MNKRQPTFLKSADTRHIKTRKPGESVRTHVLDKANSLQQDIASLGDPNISELYELLTTELRGSSHSDQKNDPATTNGQTERSEVYDIQSIWANSKTRKTDVANYVHNMTTELKDICLAADLKFLAYLVDMARLEANSILAQGTEDKSEPTDLKNSSVA